MKSSRGGMMRIKIWPIYVFSLLFVSVIASAEPLNFIQVHQLKKIKTIQDNGISFRLIPTSKSFGYQKQNQKGFTDVNHIIVGFPKELTNESFMFGAVITKVSEKKDEAFGNLKMASLVVPVRTELVLTTEKKALVLNGQVGAGNELEPSKKMIEIPIQSTDEKFVNLDLSILGEKLDIAYYLNDISNEGIEGLTHLESKTVSVDYSFKTLVFDIESTYTTEDVEKNIKTVTITSRWFLKLNIMNPFFERRKNTEGVGYFTVEFGKDTWISRFPIHDLKNNPVKYYVKNVPQELRPAILAGFEDWNHKLQDLLGHDLISYEILESTDPRYEQIIAGDVRYNVLEWDIDNLASYGGLGPSLKNSLSGEVMAAQTLIQGPTILTIYKNWFNVQEQLRTLRKNNQIHIAEKLEKDFLTKAFNRTNRLKTLKKAKVEFAGLKLYVPAQDPRLHDPLAVDPLDYLQVPEGYTYERYMNGYWREIIAHELGHNLGLRHNFRGNLKDPGTGNTGSVSYSVMEYMPRTHRHLNRVSEHDVMAIAYGYLGILPERKDLFCTDGDQAIYSYKNSAECSNADAGNDPLKFFDQRINRGLDLLLARGADQAPEWTAAQVWGTMGSFIRHLSAYAYSAPLTAHTWTHFFGKEGRPQNGDEVPQYILSKLNEYICGESLEKEVATKSTGEARAKTEQNLRDYQKAAFALLKSVPAPWSLVNSSNFKCYKE